MKALFVEFHPQKRGRPRKFKPVELLEEFQNYIQDRMTHPIIEAESENNRNDEHRGSKLKEKEHPNCCQSEISVFILGAAGIGGMNSRMIFWGSNRTSQHTLTISNSKGQRWVFSMPTLFPGCLDSRTRPNSPEVESS